MSPSQDIWFYSEDTPNDIIVPVTMTYDLKVAKSWYDLDIVKYEDIPWNKWATPNIIGSIVKTSQIKQIT